ncbi:MAG TPA: glycosyltransferase [Deltaproteobacteria bacterium]|nr:glycosyltransferase [Deltaproteobacteria bacterium]
MATRDRPKVLQIFKYYYPNVGGVEKVAQDIAEGLRGRIGTQILTCHEAVTTLQENVNGIEVTRAGRLFTRFSVPVAPRFPFLMRQMARKADILHFHFPYPLADVSHLLARPAGKVVVWWHSDIVRPRFLTKLYRPLQVQFLKKAHAIIVAAPQLIDSSPTLERFRDKCHVIPIGIDVGRFILDEDKHAQVQKIRSQYGPRIVLFVGRLAYYKGVDYLVRSMKDIDGTLLIVGEGPLEAEMKGLATSMGIEDRCVFLGKASDEHLSLYYHACDVFVLPSVASTEAYGIVQLEAMACGKPVVSTSLPTGVTFVNMHEQTGLVVPPADEQTLAAAINKLLDDPSTRMKYGSFAKERVEREFTNAAMVEKVYGLYKGVAEAPSEPTKRRAQ